MSPIEQLAAEATAHLEALAKDFPNVPVHIGTGVMVVQGMSPNFYWHVVIGDESGDGNTFEQAREKAARRYGEETTAALRKASAS